MKHILLTTIAAVVLVGCGLNIHEASWSGNIEAVKQAIADGADLNAKNERGETLLHHAAVFSRNEIAKLLIAKGADVNAKDKIGWTPLFDSIHPPEFS